MAKSAEDEIDRVISEPSKLHNIHEDDDTNESTETGDGTTDHPVISRKKDKSAEDGKSRARSEPSKCHKRHARIIEPSEENEMARVTSEPVYLHTISLHEICPFRRLCSMFRDSLKIPAEFFAPEHDMCYCEACHIQRRDGDYYSRGQPAKLYAIPVGWARFAVRCEPRANAMKVFDVWHRAYHGTDPSNVIDIFKTGNLVAPGSEVIYQDVNLKEGPGHYNDKWKIEGFDTKQVFVSPSIVYAGNHIYARPTSFKDPASGKTYSAQTVLQVCIKPDSYNVGRHTIVGQNLDPLFHDSELEWSTKKFGAIIIYGLLIRLAKK